MAGPLDSGTMVQSRVGRQAHAPNGVELAVVRDDGKTGGAVAQLWGAVARRVRGAPAPPVDWAGSVLAAWPEARRSSTSDRVERSRGGLDALVSPTMARVALSADVGFDLAPAPGDRPAIAEGDRITALLVVTDPRRPAVGDALALGARLEDGCWQCPVPPNAEPADLVAIGEALIDAALEVVGPVPQPLVWPAHRPASVRARFLALMHLEGHPDTIRARRAASRDPDPALRAMADGLVERGWIPTLLRDPVPTDLRAEVVERLSGSARRSALAVVVGEGDTDAVIAVLTRLARQRGTMAGITPALAAPDPAVRLAAVQAMAWLTGDRERPAIEALSDLDGRVVWAAARLLGAIGGEPSLRALRGRARSPLTEPPLRQALDDACRRIIARYDKAGYGDQARAIVGIVD